MTDALREAIARVGQAEAALHALQKEQHDIIRFSTGDFKWGDDDVFFSFAGRCVAAQRQRTGLLPEHSCKSSWVFK